MERMQSKTAPKSAGIAEAVSDEKYLECAVILIFVAVFLFLKVGQMWDYRISHAFPVYYNANDNFWNGYVQPQHIKEVGNLMYEPPYVFAGDKDIIGYYPPVMNYMSAMFSMISGVEVYDTTYLIAVLFSISAILLVYFAIRRYSKNAALLSIPFMIGVFSFSFEIANAFGLWMFLAGACFLAAVVWVSDRMAEKHSFLILAILLSGAAFSHMSEAIFAAGFLAFYFFLSRLKDGASDKSWLKNTAVGFGIFLALSAYYLVIFKYTWTVGIPYRFEVMSAPPFAPNYGVKFSDFWITIPLIFAGMLISLKKLAFRKRDEFPFAAVCAGLFMLAIGYSNYVGFGIRAWQTRITWPVYFAVFSGIAIYFVLKKAVKNFGFRHAAIISVLLILSFSYMHEGKLLGRGLVGDKGWDALMWIKQNTPENSKVAYFYDTLVSQSASLWSAGRVPYVITLEEYLDGGTKGEVRENYSMAPFVDGSAKTPYRKSFFEYGYRAEEPSRKNLLISYELADYYVLAIGAESAGNPNIAQYNYAIMAGLLKHPGVKEAYNNGEYSILRRS